MEAPTQQGSPTTSQDSDYRKWFRHHKTGEIIRAEDYGLKAFRFRDRKKK